MFTFRGKVAAVTGAGSGIGAALARNLARQGCNLALCDIDDVGLKQTAADCAAIDGSLTVTTATVDVADRAAVEAFADRVVAEHGAVHLVVNNAGVALAAGVAEMSYEDFEWLMGINFWGVVHGTKAFLPHLEAAGEGHIVNLSSVFGLVSIPTQSAYNAAKFAVRGFTDALYMELRIAGSKVSTTTVHPGGVKTNIARRARVSKELEELSGGRDGGDMFERVARTTPDRAAEQILAAVAHRRRRVLVGPDAKVIDVVARLPQAIYQSLLIAGMRGAGKRL